MSNQTISAKMQFSNFEDFWQHYVRQHMHPLNQILHAAGTIGGLACLVLATCLSWKWLLLALPLGYGAAWLGHFLVERNRPLTFTYPLWSFWADYRLVGLMVIGRRPTQESRQS